MIKGTCKRCLPLGYATRKASQTALSRPTYGLPLSCSSKGHPEAQTRLGYSYLQGKGLPKNDQLAVELFQQLAKQFHPAGQNLGYSQRVWRQEGLGHRAVDLGNTSKQATWLQHTEPERVQVQRA